MIPNSPAALVRAAVAALAILATGVPVQAQQPSANAIALAKDIITAKGVANMYDPIVPNTIERAKGALLQVNPMLSRDLNEVALKLRSEMNVRAAEVFTEVAKLYAKHFTEQELKDALAFYRSPLGKKLIAEEPAILDESVSLVSEWQRRFAEEVLIKIRAEMKKKGHDL